MALTMALSTKNFLLDLISGQTISLSMKVAKIARAMNQII
jgi:hypothetical protein